MHALSLTRTALALVSIASLSIAICPGYNYGFINAGISAGGNNVWWIVDDFCDSVDACYNRNPCTCSNLGCSSAPVHVDRVKVNNLWYYCRPDPRAGDCKGWKVESCCRNDGRRNLAEGRITERHFAAIDETNSMLDKHRREYEEAVGRGLSDFDLEVIRVRHRRDLEDAEKREAEAAAHVAEE